jgi:RNA polymerase sigma-70 factor (ECF subfamily)
MVSGTGVAGTVACDDAFAVLIERYRGALVSLALDRTGRFDIADEIAQEAMVKAWEHRSELRAIEAVGPWLFRIAINCCIVWQRGERRAAASLEVLADGAGWEPPVIEELIRRDTIREVRRALADLPIQSRVAVLMNAMGYRGSEIAEFLSLPESTIRGRLARARDRLRRSLGNRLQATLGDKEREGNE